MMNDNSGSGFLIVILIFGTFVGCSTAINNEKKIKSYHDPCHLTITENKEDSQFTIYSKSGKKDVQIQFQSESGDTGFLKFKCNTESDTKTKGENSNGV
jgi:hypothetical protein